MASLLIILEKGADRNRGKVLQRNNTVVLNILGEENKHIFQPFSARL